MRLDRDNAKALLGKFVADVRGNRLWPLALVLLVAIVAVPIALSKSPSGAPRASGPQATPAPAAGTAVPALNVAAAGRSRLPGGGRNPFAGQSSGQGSKSPTSTATSSSAAAATSAGGSAAVGTAGARTASGGSTSALPTASPTPPPSIVPPNQKPAPAPSGLTANQSYRVSLAITNSSGGLDAIDPLERLSVLPSSQQPLLVELGVLQGGRRVLFAVQPGTVLNGPGVCTPGPIDCEILSLASGQTEGMSRQTSAGVVQGPLFAVTGIAAANQPSVQAANAARRQAVAAGRSLLDDSPLTALSMFEYEPSVGAVVDLRNLAVGGS